MPHQLFSRDNYSVRPTDLPPDDEPDADLQWIYYCETASQLAPSDIMEIVLDELRNDDSPLLDAIHEAIRYPYEPGCSPKVNASDALRLGKGIIALLARIIDDQVTMIQAGEVQP